MNRREGLALAAGILIALAVIGFTVASLLHDPPKPPPSACPPSDQANRWCVR